MAIDHSRLRMIIKVMRDYRIRGDILTVGVQDIMDTHERVQTLIETNGLVARPIPSAERRIRFSKGQKIFKDIFKLENPMHGDDLFRMLGFDTIHSIDAFDNDQPSIVHDLNKPLPAEHHGRYDFVLDIGCSEHIFDARQSMKNLSDALKVGGVICYYLPMLGWHNECFHNFQPPLFFDVFSANGYDDMKLYLNFFPKYYLRDEGKTHWIEYKYGDRLNFRRAFHYTHLLFVARKVEARNEFVSPLQSYYLQWFDKAGAAKVAPGVTSHEDSHYMLENLPKPIVRMLPWLVPIYRMMPYFMSAPIVDAMIALKNWKRLRQRERFSL